MPSRHLEFHVEEASMEAFIRAWVRQVLPDDCTFDVRRYRGKPALLRKLGDRLRGYARWIPPEYRIVIVVDRDNDECQELKSRLERICENAGLRSRRTAGSADWQVVTRIAIEELEAWKRGTSATGRRCVEPILESRQTFLAKYATESLTRSLEALGRRSSASSRNTGTSGRDWPRCRPPPISGHMSIRRAVVPLALRRFAMP